MRQGEAKKAAGLPGAGEGRRVEHYVGTIERRAADAPSGVFCQGCGLEYEEGYRPDPCLGYLSDVAHACCGHGDAHGHPYVTGAPGVEPDRVAYEVDEMPGAFNLNGLRALNYFRERGVGPPSLPA